MSQVASGTPRRGFLSGIAAGAAALVVGRLVEGQCRNRSLSPARTWG